MTEHGSPPEALSSEALKARAVDALRRLDALPRHPDRPNSFADADTVDQSRAIMADALVAGGARTDSEGTLLVPENMTIQKVVLEEGKDSGPTAVALVRTEERSPKGGQLVREERIPVVDFRTRFQEVDGVRLHPYQTAFGLISGNRAAEPVESEPVTIENRAPEASTAAKTPGEEEASWVGRGYLDQVVARELGNRDASTADLEAIRSSDPERFAQAVQQAVAEMPAEPRNVRREDIENLAQWDPRFQSGLRRELGMIPRPVLEGLGYRLDRTQAPPVFLAADGSVASPWEVIKAVSAAPDHADRMNTAINRAYLATSRMATGYYSASNEGPGDEQGSTSGEATGQRRGTPLMTDIEGNPATLRDLPRAFATWFREARQRLVEAYERTEPIRRRVGPPVGRITMRVLFGPGSGEAGRRLTGTDVQPPVTDSQASESRHSPPDAAVSPRPATESVPTPPVAAEAAEARVGAPRDEGTVFTPGS